MLYQVILYLHVASALGFFLFHGATASATFGLKREEGVRRIKPLLQMRETAATWSTLSLIVSLISGIVLGFMGRYWSEAWIWIALGIFVVITLVMSWFGRDNFDRVSYMIDPEKYKAPRDKKNAEPTPASEEELAAEQAKGRPMMLTVTGIAALGLILWLMMFKPF